MDKESLALGLLPERWRQEAQEHIRCAEEIRLRSDRRPTLLIRGAERPFSPETVKENDLLRILEKATGASLHAAQGALSEGYVNYRGIRLGVCGAAAMKTGETSVFHRVTSLAIRIPRERKGICAELIDGLLEEGYENTLVIGRPGAGKTTLLRELIRRLSDAGYRVGVADERNELSALDGEGATFDLGRCSDVLSGLPKGKAALMLLRGMNPGIIAMDEISREEDLEILFRLCGCGVGILASLHAAGKEDLRKRRGYAELLEKQLFSRLLFVQNSGAERSYRLEKWEQ